MSAKSRSSATSLMVKSNSLRATKSMAPPCCQASAGLHGDLGADHADLERRVGVLQRLGDASRREAKDGVEVCMTHQVVAARAAASDGVHADAGRRGVDQLAARHQGGGLGEPGREPERS